MNHPVKSPRKLIEVALPLDIINEACAYEKMPGIGPHPRGIHLWWARRPLAAARAIIFAQLVNDPGTNLGRGFKYGVNKNEAAIERKRLFKIVEDLVQWKNTCNEEVWERAREEIRRSWREVCELNKDHPQATELFNPDVLPSFHDPFAGGGAIPLEAQRLGLESYASDLNPVAVLINMAMIQIPPKFVNVKPVGPVPEDEQNTRLDLPQKWPGVTGLAEDVRRYGRWVQKEARKRIAHLYAPIKITTEIANDRPDLKPLLGQEVNVVAWLWARTVKSPNPAFSSSHVPLVSSYILSNASDKSAYVEPVIEQDRYKFKVRIGTPPENAKLGTKASGRGANFRCLLSDTPIGADYIRANAQSGQMSQRLMAIVANGPRGKLYLPPTKESEQIALESEPSWKPEFEFFQQALGFRVGNYGMTKWSDLFTSRQLTALATFSDLISEVRTQIHKDALLAGMHDGEAGLEAGGNGALAYSEAVSTYLAFAMDRCADFSNSVTRWVPGNQKVMNLFGKQTISMTWDYPEANILADGVGGYGTASDYISECMKFLAPTISGYSVQAAAQSQTISKTKIVSSDPPYYDNIGYADLSDFFYVWLRRTLRSVFPNVLATIAVPKHEELVATPSRHGGDDQAERFFLEGMTAAITNLAKLSHPEVPITIYYAFKQSDTNAQENTSSTGWETFLNAVLTAGLAIVGTWPLRSEQEFRMRSMGSNALASSIVLVCRRRPLDAPTISRREFMRELNQVLPEALDEMTKGAADEHSPVAPVDLSQSIIGPGMAVFSKYASVLEADGTPMSVQTALHLINRYLAEDDFDRDTQFCLHWFEQHGWDQGPFGDAETLSRAKGTSVEGVRDAGVIKSGAGKVRLLKWSEYDESWDPNHDNRNPIWETLHHLIRTLKHNGETGGGRLLASVKNQAEPVRQLAYRLYTLCERQGWSEDARAYNELITSWSAIESAAAVAPVEKQLSVFD